MLLLDDGTHSKTGGFGHGLRQVACPVPELTQAPQTPAAAFGIQAPLGLREGALQATHKQADFCGSCGRDTFGHAFPRANLSRPSVFWHCAARKRVIGPNQLQAAKEASCT